jgi:hypothetical protein
MMVKAASEFPVDADFVCDAGDSCYALGHDINVNYSL